MPTIWWIRREQRRLAIDRRHRRRAVLPHFQPGFAEYQIRPAWQSNPQQDAKRIHSWEYGIKLKGDPERSIGERDTERTWMAHRFSKEAIHSCWRTNATLPS
jgi:hypothetical protein